MQQTIKQPVVRAYAIGTTVIYGERNPRTGTIQGEPIRATITAVTLLGGPRIRYQLLWRDSHGLQRRAWVEEAEVDPTGETISMLRIRLP